MLPFHSILYFITLANSTAFVLITEILLSWLESLLVFFLMYPNKFFKEKIYYNFLLTSLYHFCQKNFCIHRKISNYILQKGSRISRHTPHSQSSHPSYTHKVSLFVYNISYLYDPYLLWKRITCESIKAEWGVKNRYLADIFITLARYLYGLICKHAWRI